MRSRMFRREKVRVHICWGNYEGPHVCDIPMARMFDTLMSTKSRYVLFETSNPRHAHEWTVFEERKSDIPGGQGSWCRVLSIRRRILWNIRRWSGSGSRRFTGIVGSDRVIAGSDCGFGTFAGFRRGRSRYRLCQS